MEGLITSLQLRDALRIALLSVAIDEYLATIEDASPRRDEASFRALTEGIILSRRFILSYQFVVIGCLACFKAVHWGTRFIRWRRKRHRTACSWGKADDGDTGRDSKSRNMKVVTREMESSSGSSLSDAMVSESTIQSPDEHTPLLYSTNYHITNT